MRRIVQINIYELANGLKTSQISCDLKWYHEKFINELRNVIMKNIIVKTSSNLSINLINANFPTNLINDDQNIIQFINLSLSKKYYPNIISKEDCKKWRDRIWDSNQFVSIDDIVSKIQKDPSLLYEKQLKSLNEFILFLSNYNKNLVYMKPIIPNLNNVFQCINNDGNQMKKCQTVPDNIIEMMESLNIQWKSNHVHKLIITIDILDDKINNAENIIIETTEHDEEACINIMQFVLENNETRMNMFYLVNQLKINHTQWEKPIFIKNINQKIWEYADSITINKIVQIISSFNQDTIKERIDLIEKAITVFMDHYKTNDSIINTVKIIPNGNYNLKSLNELYDGSAIFHDHLNIVLKEYFDIDFNDRIIHRQINHTIKASKKEEISDFFNIINPNIADLDFEKQLNIAEYVISLVPQNDNQTPDIITQNQLFEIYKKLINFDLKEIIIDEKTFSWILWKNSNQIVLKKICQMIEETRTLDQFKHQFSFDDENAIQILNSIYTFENLHDIDIYEIVPNKKGQFMKKSELLVNHGISDVFYKIISYLEPESNIESKIVHPKIKIQNLQNFDVSEYQHKIKQLYEDLLENSEPDRELLELMHNLLNFDITPHNISKEEQFKLEMLHNTHIYAIKKRKRELRSPNQEEYKRWPFELIQNSVDCIPKDGEVIYNPDKNGIIEFDFKEDRVIYTHYGSPFTNRDLISLLYQYGGMKDENPSKIGRFGTGFLSTLILTYVVHVSGDFYSEEDGKLSGFEVTINRQGNTNAELNNRIKEMEQTKKMNLPTKGETKFIFELPPNLNDNDISLKAYNEGFNSLIENVPHVLIFNPSIKSIIITKGKEKISFTRANPRCQIETIIINNDVKTFFHSSIKDTFVYKPNKSTKEIKVDCVLELDSNDDIVPNKHFLYIGFPLFGPKKFESSVVFNSFELEPETERTDIIIQSDSKIQDSFESSINKFIISKGMELFQKMIKDATKKGYGKLFNVFHGLRNSSKYINFFQTNFFGKMLEILKTLPVFETNTEQDKGMKKFNEIIIPYISQYDKFIDYKQHDFKSRKEMENVIYQEFYSLLSFMRIENKCLVVYEHCSEWISTLWPSFESNFGIKQFFDMFSNFSDISDLPFTGEESKESFLNQIIIFIEKMMECNEILNQNQILININGKFVKKENIYKFELPEIYFEMLKIAKYNYKEHILHQEIDHLYNNPKLKFETFNMYQAISKIIDNIQKIDPIPLMKYVLENDETGEKMFLYTKFFRKDFKDPIYVPIPDQKYLERKLVEMLNIADKYVLEILIKETRNIDVKNNVDFLFDFVQFLMIHISKEDFEKNLLIPNQEYELLMPDEICKDMIQNENIKDFVNDFFGINLRKKLCLDAFSDIINYNILNLQNASQIIVNVIEEDEEKYKGIDKIGLYFIIFKYSSNNSKDLQIIVDLINFFFNKEMTLEIQEDETKCWSPKLTEIVIKMAIEDITKYISQFSNINEIIENEEEIYEKLPILYSFVMKYNCSNKIYPNYLGDLKTIDEIYIIFDSQIENEILEKLIHYLTLLSDPGEVEKKILHYSINLEIEFIMKMNTKCINLIWIVDEIVKGLSKLNENGMENDSFSYKDFFSFIKTNERLKIAFGGKLQDLMKENLFEMISNYEYYNRFCQTEKILKELEYLSSKMEIQQNALKVPYLIDAIFYELLIQSNLFSEVIWENLSNEPTNQSFEYNEKTYFIFEKEDNFNMKAIDSDRNIYYFVIIGHSNSRNIMGEKQKNFALNRNESNEHYIQIQIDDSPTPSFLFLRKTNTII